MKNKLRSLYIWEIFALNVFISPIYVLYLRELGFSFVEISTLHIVREMAIIVLEVPSGVLSDHLKRKTMLMISAPCFTLGMLMFVISDNFYIMAIGFFLWGAAIALHSGTADAYAYECLEDKSKFPAVISNMDVIRRIGSIYTKMMGPVLYSVNMVLPFVGSVVMGVGSFITSASLKEEKKVHKKREKTYLKEGLEQLKLKEIQLPIITFAAMLAILNSVFLFQQNILVEFGVDPIYLSVIYGLFFMFGSIGSYSSRHLGQFGGYIKVMTFVIVSCLVTILVIGFSGNVWIVLGAMFIQSLIHGVIFPTQSMHMNKLLKDRNRSGILSLQSLIRGMIKSLITLVAGGVADRYGIINGVLSIGGFTVLLLALWLIRSPKIRS